MQIWAPKENINIASIIVIVSVTGTVVIGAGIAYAMKGIFSYSIIESPAEQVLPAFAHPLILVVFALSVVGLHRNLHPIVHQNHRARISML